MVLLTIIEVSNDFTVLFKEPLLNLVERSVEHIRLVSCSLYNSWHNLSRSGEISVFDAQDNSSVKTIPEGNYSLKSLGEALEDRLKNEGVKVQLNASRASLEIKNPQNKKILLDNDLPGLLGIKRRLQKINFVKTFSSFNNYLVRCDLLDENENLFNGKPSQVLACFDIAGEPFERVNYFSETPSLRKISQRNVITSMKISVTDENDKIIDFNGMPMRFEFEII